MTKTYILQKDFGTIKNDTEFRYDEDKKMYSNLRGEFILLSSLFVENNPEWFLPKEEEKKEAKEVIVRTGNVCNGKRKTAGGFIWAFA